MINKYLSTIVFAFFLLNIGLLSARNVLACNCFTPTICLAYSRAKSVFVGKLEKIETDEKEKIYTIIAYFSVEKTFKGETGKLEKVRFRICDRNSIFKVGERYFVYKEDAEINSPCNRTHSLGKQDSDFEYAESLSEIKPIFTISGIILRLSKDELKKTKIIIEKGKNKYKPVIDKDGNFSFKATRKGLYRVKMLLPFKAMVFVTSGNIGYDVKTSTTPIKTSLEYDLEFKSNECDYREIQVSKID